MTTQKIGLLKMVRNTLISRASTTLQLIWLNRFIKIKEWKMIVSITSLLVGAPVLSLGFWVIMLKLVSKKMKDPKYMRNIITKIW